MLLLDIIEHLKQPEAFLDRLRRSLGSLDGRPKIIVTTGNVVFLIVRLQALLGNFNYGKQGILDLTHTRLYTFATLRKLFEQCGFVVEEVRGIPAPFPAALGLNAFSRLLVRINGFLIRLSRGLFSYQIFMRVRRRRRLTPFSRTRWPAVSRERAKRGGHSRKSRAADRRRKAPPKRRVDSETMIPSHEAASRMPSPSVSKMESLLPYLIAAVLMFPSVIWIALDTSAWGGDQSQYGFATLEVFYYTSR